MAAGALPCRDQAPEIAEAPGMAAGALPCRDQAPEIAGQEEVVPEKEGEEQERKEQEEEEEEKVEEDEEESSEGYQRSLMHASEGGKKGYWVASLPEGGHVQWSWHPSKRKAEYAASLERRGKGPGHWVLVLKCESGGGKPLASGPSASEQRGTQQEVSGIAAEASPLSISKASRDRAAEREASGIAAEALPLSISKTREDKATREASGIAAEASRRDQQPFLDLALRALEHGMAKYHLSEEELQRQSDTRAWLEWLGGHVSPEVASTSSAKVLAAVLLHAAWCMEWGGGLHWSKFLPKLVALTRDGAQGRFPCRAVPAALRGGLQTSGASALQASHVFAKL